MNAHHQDFFVVRAVENADLAAVRHYLVTSPHKIVIELFLAGLFERPHIAALRIDSGHHMTDQSVFSGRVHALNDHQHSPAVLRVEFLLQMSQRLDTVLQQAMSVLFVLHAAGVLGIVIFQTKLLALRDTVWRHELRCFFSEFFGFHGVASKCSWRLRACESIVRTRRFVAGEATFANSSTTQSSSVACVPSGCESPDVNGTLARKLRFTDYFALAFGTMVGVGWLVVMDDWLRRGGPLGAILGFAIGGVLL